MIQMQLDGQFSENASLRLLRTIHEFPSFLTVLCERSLITMVRRTTTEHREYVVL